MSKRIIAVAISSALVIGCSTVPNENIQGPLKSDWCTETESGIFTPCSAYKKTNSLRNALINELSDISTFRSVADFVLLSAAVVGLAAIAFDRHIDWIKGSSLAAIGVTGYREYLVPEVKIDNIHKAIKRLSCVMNTRSTVLGTEKSAFDLLDRRKEFNNAFQNITLLYSAIRSDENILGSPLQEEVDKIINKRIEDLSYFLRFEQKVRSAGYKILDTTESIYISLISDNIANKPDVRQIIADMKKEARNQTLDDKDGERALNRKAVNTEGATTGKGTQSSIKSLSVLVDQYNEILKSIALLGDTYTQLDEELLACKILP